MFRSGQLYGIPVLFWSKEFQVESCHCLPIVTNLSFVLPPSQTQLLKHHVLLHFQCSAFTHFILCYGSSYVKSKLKNNRDTHQRLIMN